MQKAHHFPEFYHKAYRICEPFAWACVIVRCSYTLSKRAKQCRYKFCSFSAKVSFVLSGKGTVETRHRHQNEGNQIQIDLKLKIISKFKTFNLCIYLFPSEDEKKNI